MTIAYACVAIAAFFPFVFAGIAKIGGRGFDNNNPRDWMDTQDGRRKRANWAQLNSFEAFPVFAVAVVLAQLSGVKPSFIDALAAAFIVFRCIYGALYLADKATARSLAWAGGIACCGTLYAMAVLSVSGRY